MYLQGRQIGVKFEKKYLASALPRVVYKQVYCVVVTDKSIDLRERQDFLRYVIEARIRIRDYRARVREIFFEVDKNRFVQPEIGASHKNISARELSSECIKVPRIQGVLWICQMSAARAGLDKAFNDQDNECDTDKSCQSISVSYTIYAFDSTYDDRQTQNWESIFLPLMYVYIPARRINIDGVFSPKRNISSKRI